MTEILIRLHKPHAKQLAFKRSRAKRRVIAAGRRGGKTTGVSDIAVEALLAGYRVLEAAPTADQTNAFWSKCRRALAPAIEAGVVYKNETERVLQLPSVPVAVNTSPSAALLKELDVETVPDRPRIKTKTAWDADSLRGDYADFLILDEFSFMAASAWGEVGAPMLLDNDGYAAFIFTPNRRNHAYNLYQKAKTDDTGRWEAFRFTSFDNPHLSKEALAEITRDITEDAYRQEILAEFLEGEGAVFRNIHPCLNAPATSPEEHEGHRKVAGVDWGKQQDYTAVSVGCATCQQEVALERFNKIDYAFQRGRLEVLVERWNVTQVLPERNAMGEPIVEELVRAGLPIANGPDENPGFQTTASSKPPLIENLALVLERQEYQFLDVSAATAELEAYERTTSPTGRPRYGAPEGGHDDTVMARALMVWAAMKCRKPPMVLAQGRARGWQPK